MRRIYIASKAKYRAEWRELRAKGHNIVSRWIDTPDVYTGTTLGESDLDYTELWMQIREDVLFCHTLIAVVRPGDVLKGALVEIGIALAVNAEILVCGHPNDVEANGTWSAHPRITITNMSVESALEWCR